jgi:glycosyltransferase involved in cell wall biosynthesis
LSSSAGGRRHSKAKTLVFHDNFAQMGGAERVTEEIHRALPGSTLGTTLTARERLSAYLQAQPIKTTWMQWLPAKAKLFRWYFLLYPFAVEGFDTGQYELIVTSCFGYAKGIKRNRGALHVCYCHTPMRWVWRTSDYLARENMSPLKRRLLLLALKPLRAWEMKAAKRPDFYIANSRAVAKRLKDSFGVDSTVIAPPIETQRFNVSPEVDDYYLVLSRLVPYKRIDLAVRACNTAGRKLKIIGSGPDLERLREIAGNTVEFLGRQSDEMVATLISRCRALIFPGEEDFGMTPLEANAAGRPVIAFAGGGALETIIPGLNGIFFDEPTVDSLVEAIERFEAMNWQPEAIRAHAETYDAAVFHDKIHAFLDSVSTGTVVSAEAATLRPSMR